MYKVSHLNKKYKGPISIKGEDFWSKWIIEFKNSKPGISKKSFCRENDLNYDRFRYWFKKFINNPKKTQDLIPVTLSDIQEVCVIELNNGHRIIINDKQTLLDYLLRLT